MRRCRPTTGSAACRSDVISRPACCTGTPLTTDGTRVSVINAPAGSGKTRVLTETSRAWTTAGLGPVVGITAAQSARNTLAAGVPVSYNAAQFLGHLPGRRGARGPIPIGPGHPAGDR